MDLFSPAGLSPEGTTPPEDQQDKSPAMDEQTEDNWGHWLKYRLEISGMVNKVLEKQKA